MTVLSPEEVKSAVERIVRGEVRNPTGTLGDREIGTSFSDLQEAAAGVFVLYYNAPFYVAYLGAQQVLDLVSAQSSTISALADAVRSLRRLVTPITDLSSLANARSALSELSSAVSSRESGFSSTAEVPAFRRYARSLQQFLSSYGTNVVGTATNSKEGSPGYGQLESSLVDTPTKAAEVVASLASTLKSSHDELVRRVSLLEGAMRDFNALNLPKSAALGVLSRSNEVLSSHYEALAQSSEAERMSLLRQVFLDLLVQQPLVEKYGALQPPSEYLVTSGALTAYADATHPALSASVIASAGPYPVVEDANWLSVSVDGGSPLDYALPMSTVASLQGTIKEPFDVQPTSDSLRVQHGDLYGVLNTYDIALPNGLLDSATVVSTINAALAGTSLQCSREFYPLRYNSVMSCTATGGNTARLAVLGGSLQGLGVTVGDEVDFLSGPDTGTTWAITAVDPGWAYVDVDGVSPATSYPDVLVKLGPPSRVIRLADTDLLSSVTERRILRLPSTSGEEDNAARLLGFYPGIASRSYPTHARDLASVVNGALPGLRASVASTVTNTLSMRTDAMYPDRAVFSVASLNGSCASGTVVLFSSTDSIEDVEPGMPVVVRESSVGAEVGVRGSVNSVGTSILEIAFASPIAGGSYVVEVGSATAMEYGDVLTVDSGVLKGRYVVQESSGNGTSAYFEVLIQPPFSTTKVDGAPLVVEASIAKESLVFSSSSTLLSGEVEVGDSSYGSAYSVLFTDPAPTAGLPSTNWLSAQVWPESVAVGDILQLYADYENPPGSYAIEELDQSSGVLRTSYTAGVGFSVNMSMSAAAPYGRIRVGKVANFEGLRSSLQAWLARSSQQESYWRRLAGALSVVLSGSPTIAEVNNALTVLDEMWKYLSLLGATTTASSYEDTLEHALKEYDSPVSQEVLSLLRTLRSKGADRAASVLLEGRFTDFFGADVHDSSYSGTLLKRAREMSMEDLPVRKLGRKELAGEIHLGSTIGEDFEYSSEDADSAGTPDVPTNDVF